MFKILALMFGWLPAPLNVIVFGAICIALVVAVMRVIAAFKDMIPFL